MAYKRKASSRRKSYSASKRRTSGKRRSSGGARTQTVKLVIQHEMAAPRPTLQVGQEGALVSRPVAPKTSKL